MKWFRKKDKEPEWVPVTAKEVADVAKKFLADTDVEYRTLEEELLHVPVVDAEYLAKSFDVEEALELRKKQKRLNSLRWLREVNAERLLHSQWRANWLNQVKERPE